ncbi:MAG: twin-arginine translocase subunit TatC, partial [Halorhabdus sp.]
MTDGDGPDDADDRAGNGHDDPDPDRDDAVDSPDTSEGADAYPGEDSPGEEYSEDRRPDEADDTDSRDGADDESETTPDGTTSGDAIEEASDESPDGYETAGWTESVRTADEPPAMESPRETFETDPTETPAGKAPDDEEMPLSDHIEEMVRRLGVVLVLMAGVSAVVFPFGMEIINTIWYSFLPGTFEQCPTTGTVVTEAGKAVKPTCPRVYNPIATILARFKVATLAGFVVALPGFVYETYLFMRPGLFPRERRYYLAAVPTSLILATVGLAFAYLLVLPAIFTYFLYYSQGAANIAFGLTETFDLMVLMMGFFAAIFQIPLFIMLAIMMGVTSRQWLADRRLLFWAAFAGIAFIFNPDPTGMAPFIIAATMIALFEGTLLLLSWTGSEGLFPSPDAVAARRPYAWLLAGVAGYLASDAPLPAGYYEQLPGVVSGFIERNDLIGMTPLVVGGALIAGYELVVFLLARYFPMGRLKQAMFSGRVSLRRLRAPVWIISLTVGYFASPDPFLLDRANEITLAPVEAAGLAAGLIVAFEIMLAIWRYVRPAEGER